MATDKQMAYGRALGIEINPYLTSAEASDVLSTHLEAKRKRDLVERSDKFGRVHGWQRCFGNGSMHFTYGVMDYCDDGNGNEWMSDDGFYGDDDD